MKPVSKFADGIQPTYSRSMMDENCYNFVSSDDDDDEDEYELQEEEEDIDNADEEVEEEEDEFSPDSGENKSFSNVNVGGDSIIRNGSPHTVGLYSSFDNIVGGSFLSDSSYRTSLEEQRSEVNAHDISSHLKGALTFGLPMKKLVGQGRVPNNFMRGKVTKSPRGNSRGRILNSKGGLKVHRPVVPKKKEPKIKVEKKKITDIIDHLNEELLIAYRIVSELMADSLKNYNSIFMETIEMDPSINGDYLEVVKNPIWLPKIKEKILKMEYTSLTEVVAQLRLMLENTYRYFGPVHSFSKKGMRIEFILEQKLALLPREIRTKCKLENTSGAQEEESKEVTRSKSARITVNGDNFFSHLLYNVRSCRQSREKEKKRRKMEILRLAKLSKENEIVVWEESLLTGHLGGPMRNMWEIPQISQFIFLSLKVLNISEVTLYEIERIFMIPEASLTLRMVMTSLVSSPQQRLKLSEKPFMPYSVWARRLAHKTFQWYKMYYRESMNADKLYEQFGIEPNFWRICGSENPFETLLFHEMTFYQRVWLIKTLCDYVAHNHKSVQEAIAEQPEENLRESLLGYDSKGNEYIHFPQLLGNDLRIYRRAKSKQSQYENIFVNESSDQCKLFSKEKIKSFRKLMKRIRKNQERDEDWEYNNRRAKKKLPKKKSKHKPFFSPFPSPSLSAEKRSRPERLRQAPKSRYSEDSFLSPNFDFDSSFDEDLIYVNAKKKRAEVDNEESEEEDEDDEENEKMEVDVKKEGDEEREKKKVEEGKEVEEKKELGEKKAKDEVDIASKQTTSLNETCSSPAIPTESKKVNKTRKQGGRRISCKICGKNFSSKSAMYGHLAIHAKKKIKPPSGEPESNALEKSSEQQRDTVIKGTKLVDSKAITEEINDISMGDGVDNSKKVVDEIISEGMVDKKENLMDYDYDNRVGEDFGLHGTNLVDEKDQKILAKNLLGDLDEKEMLCDSSIDQKLDLKDFVIKKENSNEVIKDKLIEGGSDCNSVKLEVNNKEGYEESNQNIKLEYDSSTTPTEVDPELILEPDSEEFELVAASVAELRSLILRFGSLPSKFPKEKSKQDGEEEKDDDIDNEKNGEANDEELSEEGDGTKCEERLHRALCKLFTQLAPLETKFTAAHRQMRKKLHTEFLDWTKSRTSSYVDPAEEAWKSDTEPDPAPSATQTPKPSSSSSSSEESYNGDGTRKRKLRKRRAKRVVQDSPLTFIPVSAAPTPVESLDEETIAVSSRGRVRKVKRIINYDRLDFDKLALQAEKDAQEEKERKKKRKEEDEEKEKEFNEKALEEAAQNLQIPSSGVRRYILSKTGEVIGYIGNDGQVHSGQVRPNKEDNTKEESVKTPKVHTQTISIPIKTPDDKVPKLVVAALNEDGTTVYVRTVGAQAMQLMKLIEAFKNEAPRQVRLQRLSHTYTFSTDSIILTQNITGYPDCDITNIQLLTSPTVNSSSQSPVISKPVISKDLNSAPPTKTFMPNASVASNTCKTTNPIALAYQGLPSVPARPSVPVPKISKSQISINSCASLSASTSLVTASPSVVPSAPPITAFSSQGPSVPVAAKPVPLSAPSLLVQTDSGQPVQVGITPDRFGQTGISNQRLSQVVEMVQKLGQRIMAVPNKRGGYTLTLVGTPKSQENTIPTATSGVDSKTPLPSFVPKPVLTQVVQSTNSTNSIVSAPSLAMMKGPSIQQPLTVPLQSQHHQSQQIVNQYSMNSQIANTSSPVNRQVVLQHTMPGSSPNTVMTTLAQPTQQMVHIAANPVMQQPQPQFLHIQQPQKVVQVVHSSGRQLMQMIQPGQVFMAGNNLTTVQQPTSVIVPSSQANVICSSKQATLMPQQQVVIQQSPQPQPKVIQVPQQEQYVQQQVVLQPQQHFIIQQSPQSVIKNTQLAATSQTQQIQNSNQMTQTITQQQLPHMQQIQTHQHMSQTQPAQQTQILQQQIHHTLPQTSTQQIHLSIPHSRPEQMLQSVPPVNQIQQQPQVKHFEQQTSQRQQQQQLPPNEQVSAHQQPKAAAQPLQASRLVLLQTSEGQKICAQLADGRLSLLTPEQLQPFIASGALKISS